MTENGNIFEQIPEDLPEELIEVIAEGRNVRIERIVSKGHASPEGFWYNQEGDEFVILLKGAAKLRFEGEEELTELKAGDWLTIPAHRRHRVEWTSESEETVWLAVHY